MTKAIFYKQRKNRMICGVVAGLADKYGWDLPIARVLTALFVYFSGALVLFSTLFWQSVCPIRKIWERTDSQAVIIRDRANARMLRLLMIKIKESGFGDSTGSLKSSICFRDS